MRKFVGFVWLSGMTCVVGGALGAIWIGGNGYLGCAIMGLSMIVVAGVTMVIEAIDDRR